MRDLTISLEIIPSKIENDYNKGINKWVSGRLVESSSGDFISIYINHEDELVDDVNGETTVITRAFHLKIKKPININKVVIEAVKKAYQLESDRDYNNFLLDLSRLLQEEPDNNKLTEYSKFIQWVKDGYNIINNITAKEAKKIMLRKITEYDSSNKVNSFILNDKSVWLDKDTRVGLMNSITIEQSVGYTETTLWLGTNSYTLPIDTAIKFLIQLEIYAKNCYNKTAEHKANIEKLTFPEEILEYNYKEGYPEKLNISI